MFTCEEIEEMAHEMEPVVTRENYRAVADTIFPFTLKPAIPDQQIEAMHLPEWEEEKRADKWSTDDYADVVVFTVAHWQANQAIAERLEGK